MQIQIQIQIKIWKQIQTQIQMKYKYKYMNQYFKESQIHIHIFREAQKKILCLESLQNSIEILKFSIIRIFSEYWQKAVADFKCTLPTFERGGEMIRLKSI